MSNCKMCKFYFCEGNKHRCKKVTSAMYVGELDDDGIIPDCSAYIPSDKREKKMKSGMLVQMRDMLFQEMQNLQNCSKTDLEKEIRKAGALANLATNVTDVSRLQIEAVKTAYSLKAEKTLPMMLGCDDE